MNEPSVPDRLSFTPQKYISERVEQYQKWYDGKAVKINVPSQYTLWGAPVIQVFVTFISLLVVVGVSLESVFHYREQWKNYRSTEQLLGHEKFLYQSRVGRYRGLSEEDAFRLFVERIEESIAIENAATLNVMTMASETVESTQHAKPGQS